MINLFTKENLLYLLKELIWWAITGLLIYALLYPITSKISYTYWLINSVFMFVALTYFRWCVTFRSLVFLHSNAVRFTIFTLNIILFFYLMQSQMEFIAKLDDFYTEDFGFPKVMIDDVAKRALFEYLNYALILFGTTSLLMITAFQFRIIISYWQLYKYKASRMLED